MLYFRTNRPGTLSNDIFKQLEEAEKKDFAIYKRLAVEELNNYAKEIGQNQLLMVKLQAAVSGLQKRIVDIVNQELVTLG